jgi:NADPH:quinone reductase-like Zn-dependent oxidoreductase
MRAAVLHGYGEPPVPGDFDDPVAGEGQLVVDVLAAGLNPVDLAIASGRFYGPRPSLPSVVGREGVGRTQDGSRVLFGACVAPYGSFAERALVEAAATVPLPDVIDDGPAVALWTAGLAAYVPLERVARLAPGESVLVLGSSGAVGQLALQVARILGAGLVVAAARSSDGLERSLALGADVAVPLTEEGDVAAALREACDGGFDVILDLLWGKPAHAAIEAAAPYARMVQVGNAAAPTVTLAAPALRSRNLSLTGYTSALVSQAERAAAHRRLMDHAIDGRLQIEIERVELDEVPDAWARQAEGPHRKLIIVP